MTRGRPMLTGRMVGMSLSSLPAPAPPPLLARSKLIARVVAAAAVVAAVIAAALALSVCLLVVVTGKLLARLDALRARQTL